MYKYKVSLSHNGPSEICGPQPQRFNAMPPIHKNHKGFTIVESMVALLILFVVTAAIGRILVMAMGAYNFNFGIRSAHQQALNYLEEVRSDCDRTANWLGAGTIN